jgi:hypothetical protein
LQSDRRVTWQTTLNRSLDYHLPDMGVSL